VSGRPLLTRYPSLRKRAIWSSVYGRGESPWGGRQLRDSARSHRVAIQDPGKQFRAARLVGNSVAVPVTVGGDPAIIHWPWREWIVAQ